MAVVIPIGKMKDNLETLARYGTNIYIRLKNTNTAYVDRVSGWTIKGDEIKELPPPDTLSQSLLESINAGRFVRVKSLKSTQRSKAYELVDYILEESAKSEEERAD